MTLAVVTPVEMDTVQSVFSLIALTDAVKVSVAVAVPDEEGDPVNDMLPQPLVEGTLNPENENVGRTKVRLSPTVKGTFRAKRSENAALLLGTLVDRIISLSVTTG